MGTAVQYRRGTTINHSTFIGLEGEITLDTTKNVPVVHDGLTAGGIPTAKASDVTDLASIVNTKAPLANPNLTGIPTAPTPNIGTNSTQIATTAFVANTIGTQTISTAAPTGGVNNDTWYQY